MIDKSDVFAILCIACLALAGFAVGEAVGYLALAIGFGFFAVATHEDQKPKDDD